MRELLSKKEKKTDLLLNKIGIIYFTNKTQVNKQVIW